MFRASRKNTAVQPQAGGTAVSVPPRGVEQTRFRSRKRQVEPRDDVKPDVGAENRAETPPVGDPAALTDLAARIASLPPEVLAALSTLFGGRPPER